MWMMGYSDGGEFTNNIQDSFTGRGRLRPLMPRTPVTAAASTNPPCFFHGGDLFALNHHFAMAEQNKRESNATQQVVVSSRWNPTPEQLQSLEELYRRGTRTPSAEQIQHITAELRRFGKIEGKNVFYWFQNHKARERQKRRRQLESSSDEQPHNDNHNGQKKESLEGANRTTHEVEQTKYWASPTNSSTIPPEKTLSRQGASKAAAETENEAADGWVQFDDTDDAADHLQQQRKNATWQMMHNLSCSPSHPANLINPSIASNSVTTTIPSLVAIPNFVDLLHEPYTVENRHRSSGSSDGGVTEAQTLQLFPLLGNGRQSVNEEYENEEGESGAASNNGIHGYQFFEFLPLKN